jgi:hypothetical protein
VIVFCRQKKSTSRAKSLSVDFTRREAHKPLLTLLPPMTSPQDYRRLAAEESALAEVALTNESRAQHYAMASYYTRLTDAKERSAMTTEVVTGEVSSDGPAPPIK